MEKGSGSAVATPHKCSARAALINVQDPTRTILSDCFRQFGVETVAINGDAAERMMKEKFEACVVKLTPDAEAVMESARTSTSNSRMVIYGLGGSIQEAMKFSKYGINAVFNEPLERPAALKLVRATQSLVMHEFRRYVRIPVVTEVQIITNANQKIVATSCELSSGGMSLRCPEELGTGQSVEVSFALLTLPRIWVKGTIVWRKAAQKTFGIRFDTQDDRRLRVREWIDAFLES